MATKSAVHRTAPDQHASHAAPDAMRIAEAVRAACLEAARAGYESAGMSGLCHEGAMEMSLDSIRRMDLAEVVRDAAAKSAP